MEKPTTASINYVNGKVKVTKEFVVEYAHRLLHHKGACNHLHGHSGRVIVSVTGVVDATTGMIIDFSDLKKACETAVMQYDHALILNVADPLVAILSAADANVNLITYDSEPTAENFSNVISHELIKAGFNVAEVTFFETEKNSATFTVGA